MDSENDARQKTGSTYSMTEELIDEFEGKAQEHRQQAKLADLGPLEAEQYAWADALDWAAARLRQEVNESDGK